MEMKSLGGASVRLRALIALTSITAILLPATSSATGDYVYAWGDDTYNQCNVPSTLSGVTAISGGGYHAVALKSDGTVVAFGNDTFGQLNVPSGLSGVTQVSAGWYHTLCLKSDGTVVAFGYSKSGETTVPATLSNVKQVSAGGYFSVALKNDGTVVEWGSNEYGQLNIPSGLSNVVAVSAGADHVLALKSDGSVVAWGYNVDGETNIPSDLGTVTQIDAHNAFHNLVITSSGTVRAWGRTSEGQCTVPSISGTVTSLGIGWYNSFAKTSSGTVYAWGNGENGDSTLPAGAYTVDAMDGESGSSLIMAPELPIIAANDSYSTNAGVTLTETAANGVQANDTNSSGTTATLVTNASHGTLTLNGDGSFTYVPDSGYYGSDSFTYKDVGTSATSATVTVSITVNVVAAGITSLSPNTKALGSAAFTMTIAGSNFVNGAVAKWTSGSTTTSLTTTFSSGSSLSATVPASLVASAGTATVTVTNPTTSASGSLTFTVTNPTPVVSSISPTQTGVGSAPTTLTVTGSSFQPSSVVQWNGTALTTHYSSATTLTATIPSTDFASVATASVTVQTGTPGGGTSLSKTFTVAAPAITAVTPTYVTIGHAAETLTIYGTNFLSTSTVKFNGTALAVVSASATQISATLPTSLFKTAGTFDIQVFNGTVGSNLDTFTVHLAPILTSMSPNGYPAGTYATGVSVTLKGSYLLTGMSVKMTNASGASTILGTLGSTVSGTSAVITILPSYLKAPATYTIYLISADGISSNGLTFTVTKPIG